MDLSSYLTLHDGKVDRDGAECVRLAAAAETTPYYLCMIARGHKKAGHELAKAIEAATSEVVTRSDLRPDIWGPAEVPKPRKKAA